jgi:enamine deaminase RidA (YjgF/YER057c/UK114 family)
MSRITKDFSETLDVVTLTRPGVREHWLSYRIPGGGDLSVLSDFPPARTEVLSQFIFGGCRFHDEAMNLMGEVNWPVTWVHGDGCSGESLSGAQAFGISGAAVKSIELDGRVVGRAFEDEDAEYCHLGGVLPADASQSRPSQARSGFERMEAALRRAGMDFSNVVRTWIFLENILDWYGDFNKVRTAFYQERGVFDGLIPASTGIGAANPSGAALVTGLIAVKPKHRDVRISAVPSPLQCPATSYRSSFSRAVELHLTGRRHLYISGTASIGPDGQTIHHGDVDKQIGRTMEVCEAILESRQMTWADATRVVVYFKDMRDAPRFAEYCRRRQLPELPMALSHAAVCRDELLFEVELDAVSTE